jgi:REP element-mobilizing transposase RayT
LREPRRLRGACPDFGRLSDNPDKIGRWSDMERCNLWKSRRRDVGKVLVTATSMSPRQVLPNQFYMINRRCTQRQFLLRPDPETNNVFKYCLTEAAQRCQIEVLLSCAMSNHHHTVIYDRWGRYPEFIEHFHKMVARCQNALRGRWETETCGPRTGNSARGKVT